MGLGSPCKTEPLSSDVAKKVIPTLSMTKAVRIPAPIREFEEKKSGDAEPAAPAALEPASAAAVQEPEEELADDTELVAVITAAICTYEGTSADGFVVRSIRRADRTSWNRA